MSWGLINLVSVVVAGQRLCKMDVNSFSGDVDQIYVRYIDTTLDRALAAAFRAATAPIIAHHAIKPLRRSPFFVSRPRTI